jgi:general secretion pathway protein A
LINIICDRALLGGYVNNKNQIDKHIVHKAIQEVRGESLSSRQSSLTGWLVGTLAIALLFGVLMWGWHSLPEKSFIKNLFISPNDISLSSESSEAPPKITTAPPHVPVEKPVKPIVIATEPPQNSPVEPPKLLDLLETTSTESAFITLFNLWKLDYTSLEGEKACQRAATQGLACLLRTGTWKDIRYFNRPVVLELVTANGKQHHLVVRYLQDDVATLVISGQTYSFSTKKINDFWLGQFLLLWQPPILPVPLIKVGVTNDAVIWIRKHLNIIEGRSNALETFDILSPRFDYTLRQRVIRFQRKHKLGADGIVGEETMLALQALSGLGGNPLLSRF